MATTTTDFHTSIESVLTAPFRAVLRGFEALVAAQRVNREASQLFAMTDAQLAERGLDRASIGAHLSRHFDSLK
jgi:hypothetical protein